MNHPIDLSLFDTCQWCGAGRLVLEGDDRCRCCVEDGIIAPDKRVTSTDKRIARELRLMYAREFKWLKFRKTQLNNPFAKLLRAARDQI